MFSCQTSFLLSLEGDTVQIISQEIVISHNLFRTHADLALGRHLPHVYLQNFAHPTSLNTRTAFSLIFPLEEGLFHI